MALEPLDELKRVLHAKAPPIPMDKDAIFKTIVKRWSSIFQDELKLKGFHVDGIFGNFGHETNGFTEMQEKNPTSGRGGAGWEQATGPRRVQFENFLKENGFVNADGSPDIGHEAGNAAFIIQELNTSEHAALVAIRSTRTRDDACRVFMQKDERPGVEALSSRLAWAAKAEAARLEQEGKSTVSDTSGVQGLPIAPTTAAAASPSALAETLRNIEQSLQDLATREAVSHGVPAFVPPLVERVIDALNLPDLIAREVEKTGLGPFIASIAPAIASIMAAFKK